MAGGSKTKVVGPNVKGTREEYQLVRHLQSALFGGVYEAKGLSSGRDFAIKVLHKSELSKAEETSSIEFCEVPLSEIKFAELMRGDDHVMDIEDHFQDNYCCYVVFDLCRGGDLLEALKQKPNGFDEAQAQFLVQQAAKGLAYLHRRHVAMQDVSLENMLLHVNDKTGHYQVKVCDPGQAVVFKVDENGQELPVEFRGLVGKSFRPPELHDQTSYYSTKVDSWCLGWSTFYLLTAQPLFMSADPAQKDADWLLFQASDWKTLLKQKSNMCSQLGLDFIFRLLKLDPCQRMSVFDALEHAWLADPKVMPVLAPKELLSSASLQKLKERRQQEAEAVPPATDELPLPSYAGHLCDEFSAVPRRGGACGSGSSLPRLHEAGSFSGTHQGLTSPGALPAGGGGPAGSQSITWANAPGYNGNPHTPMLRVRSPMRAPRGSGIASSPRLAADRDRRRGLVIPGVGARSPYVIATAHSPPPQLSPGSPGLHRAQNRSNGPRTASPCAGAAQHGGLHRMPLGPAEAQPPRPAFLTPRSTSRSKIGSLQSPLHKVESPEGDDRGRERAWAFKSESTLAEPTSKMEPITFFPHGRQAPSPPRAAGSALYMARSASPMQTVEAIGGPGMPHMRPTMRTPSPVTGGIPRAPAGGFSWTQAPATFSPRSGRSCQAPPAAAGLSASTPMGRAASPVAAAGSPIGFAWSPDPPSPRQTPRAYSPQPIGNNISFGTKGIMLGAVRAAPRRSGPM